MTDPRHVILILLMAALATQAPLVAPAITEGAQTEPVSHKRYWPRVREARRWLRKQYSLRQWRCLDRLWENESHWRVKAQNPTSGAYGIPQALPGRKMRSVGKDWRTNAMTQVRWGRRYVKARYGTPCDALAHQQARGWY